jgi:hypothetical protein
LNGPRSPDFLDALEQALSLEGLHSVAPLGRLHSDGVACAAGESLAEDGLLAGVEHAYYLGGGSGVAEAYRLRGKLYGADELKPVLARAWQTAADDGRSFELHLSARGINEDFRARATAVQLSARCEDAAAAGDARARDLFLERGRQLAQWCFARLEAVHRTQGIVLERIVIGQRLGGLFLDPRLADCFSEHARAQLSALLRRDAPQAVRALWLRGDQLAPDRILGSKLRAAPALGALALSLATEPLA